MVARNRPASSASPSVSARVGCPFLWGCAALLGKGLSRPVWPTDRVRLAMRPGLPSCVYNVLRAALGSRRLMWATSP